MAISVKRRKAKAFVLRQAAAWLEDQTGEASSNILNDENGEYDSDKVAEALALVRRLNSQAEKL